MYKNIFANLAGRIWGLLSVFIFIPLYIRFLGIDLYGLISFFATMQGILFLLDAGLSATLRREFSAGQNDYENKKRKYKLLRSVEFCYMMIILLIAAGTFFGAEPIVTNWLNLGNIDTNLAITTIRLMGVSIALQFLSTLYFGCLLGLEKQVIANIYQIAWSVLKNGCVIFVLWLIAPDVRLFYLWFIFIDLLYLIALRTAVTGMLTKHGVFRWKFNELGNLKNIWKYAAGIFAISIISALNVQLDKLVLSKLLPVAELGIYNMAFSLSQIPLIIVNAASITIFSRFVYYFSVNETEKQRELFLLASKLLGLISISIAVTMSFYTKELFMLWINDPGIAGKAWLPAAILTVGTMFMTLQIIPFNLVLSHGDTKINTILCFLNLLILAPLLLILAPKHGITGAAAAWLFMLLVSTPFYNNFIYRKFIGKRYLQWFVKDTLLPLLFILTVSFGLYMIGNLIGVRPGVRIIYAVLSGVLVLAVSNLLFVKNIYSQLKYIKTEFI
ncbi:MAG: oligosaccharide flippase family protein [Prolixibacteraceae bacterium]